MRRAFGAAAAAATLAVTAVAAQPGPQDVYKGRVKAGLYEVVNEYDLTAVPEVPKEQAKGSEKRRRCMSEQDVARGVQPGKECEVRSYSATDAAAAMVMACKDGTTTELKYSFSAAGFASEARTTGKQQDGKPFTSLFRTQARYLGACPPHQPAPTPSPPAKK